MTDSPIFADLAARFPNATALQLPAVTPAEHTEPLPVVAPTAELVPFGPGADAELVTWTDNGLTADDLALPQPPQDPAWTPGGEL